jgi:hypothetical protein
MQNITKYYILLINDYIYSFTSRSRIFHLYGDVTIADEGLPNLGLCSALSAFEQRGIFIVPQLLSHGISVFRSHPKDRPIQSPFTTHEGMWRVYSNPDPHGDYQLGHQKIWVGGFYFMIFISSEKNY